MRLFLTAITAIMLLAPSASAQCYADYRAQRGTPVRFHYGVAQIPAAACGDLGAAAAAIRPRLQRDGWILVDVLATFGPEGLAQRTARAGEFFLRY